MKKERERNKKKETVNTNNEQSTNERELSQLRHQVAFPFLTSVLFLHTFCLGSQHWWKLLTCSSLWASCILQGWQGAGARENGRYWERKSFPTFPVACPEATKLPCFHIFFFQTFCKHDYMVRESSSCLRYSLILGPSRSFTTCAETVQSQPNSSGLSSCSGQLATVRCFSFVHHFQVPSCPVCFCICQT